MAVEVALAMLQQEGRWFMQLRDEIPTIVAPGPVAGGSLAGSSIPERRPNRFYSANCWRKSSAASVSSASSPPIPRGSGHRARACTTPRDAAPRQARRPRFASRVAADHLGLQLLEAQRAIGLKACQARGAEARESEWGRFGGF